MNEMMMQRMPMMTGNMTNDDDARHDDAGYAHDDGHYDRHDDGRHDARHDDEDMPMMTSHLTDTMTMRGMMMQGMP